MRVKRSTAFDCRVRRLCDFFFLRLLLLFTQLRAYDYYYYYFFLELD